MLVWSVIEKCFRELDQISFAAEAGDDCDGVIEAYWAVIIELRRFLAPVTL